MSLKPSLFCFCKETWLASKQNRNILPVITSVKSDSFTRHYSSYSLSKLIKLIMTFTRNALCECMSFNKLTMSFFSAFFLYCMWHTSHQLLGFQLHMPQVKKKQNKKKDCIFHNKMPYFIIKIFLLHTKLRSKSTNALWNLFKCSYVNRTSRFDFHKTLTTAKPPKGPTKLGKRECLLF